MTTASTSAIVECLTAEVRVLMVGSRQITLSVFRQLDEIPEECLEPFGRCRDGRDDEYHLWLIGRDRRTGALARTDLFPLAPWYGFQEPDVNRRSPLDPEVIRLRQQKALFEANHKRYSELSLIILAGLR